MAVVLDSYDRYDAYKDTSLDVILDQIMHGNIQCGRFAAKLKYGKPPKEIKGWWLTNDRHRDAKEKEEPTGSGEPERSDDKSRESKQDLVDCIREIKRRRNGGKRLD